MSSEKAKVHFNHKVIKAQTKEQFLADHPHVADEAAAEWDKVHKDDDAETKPKVKAEKKATPDPENADSTK